jgi:hypothetical protein
MLDGPRVLELRRGRLDDVGVQPGDDRGLLIHTIRTLSEDETEPGDYLFAAAAEADEVIGSSTTLVRLSRAFEGRLASPGCPEAQLWLHTMPPSWLPVRTLELDSKFFVPPVTRALPPVVKPFGMGLYTSSELVSGTSAWSLRMADYAGSDLHPFPWLSYRLKGASKNVLTVDSAQAWVDLVLSFPRHRDEHVIVPDWEGIARAYAGVRLTQRAVATIQRVHFPSPLGQVAGGSWDTETTLWLRWQFSDISLVSRADGQP